MRVFFILPVLTICALAQASESVSIFPASIGNPPVPANVQITWGTGEIKSIQVTSAHRTLIQTLDITGDWTNLGSMADHNRKDIVQSVDANFDGYPDLLIESSNGSAGQLFKLFQYDPKSKKFERSSAFDHVWNPTFDQSQKIVKGKAHGMEPRSYIWQANSLKEQK